MHEELRDFLTRFAGIVALALVPVFCVALLSAPRPAPEAAVTGAATQTVPVERHLT